MKNAIAQSTYQDTYFGETTVWLMTFKTTRKAVRVVRYRWESGKPVHCGFASGGFPTVEAAMSAANRHKLMGPVMILNDVVLA